MVQRIMTEANAAPSWPVDDANDYLAFCNGEVGMLMGPAEGQPIAAECPEMEANIGVFALPGSTVGERTRVPRRFNLAVSANSQNPELAIDLLELMAGEEFQLDLVELGLLPARASLLEQVGGSPAAEAQATALNSRFVPAGENWASVEERTSSRTSAPPSPKALTSPPRPAGPTPHRGDAEPVISVLPSAWGGTATAGTDPVPESSPRRRRPPGRRRQPLRTSCSCRRRPSWS